MVVARYFALYAIGSSVDTPTPPPAATWGKQKRREFGNDPLNLLAVEASLNRQKGAGDAATWLPPKHDYRCECVSRQIAVKAKYGLWVKPAEADAMERVLSDCDWFL